ncbi:TPA: S8 family peptidase [Clostridium botulinum]|nr:peptidase S8 and S53 subtilisin kexin sedolisin [Clostridium botulinum]HBZ6638142.1 S8 family peptidase [Clostridium botulinum]HBZ7131605.1 S8 family peptidase [Clostridium botulinum]HBZ7135233.1 S8 family peptidase [Clostridium botulinum]
MRECASFVNENFINLLVEYRGDFKKEMETIDYACGAAITESLGAVAVQVRDLDRLRKEIPSIIFIEFSTTYVLQDVEVNNSHDIGVIKSNPYLNLSGQGVLVGIIDSGIDYLNNEFINEDETSRIVNIWDQTAKYNNKEEVYIGDIFTRDDINKAIEAKKQNKNPYDIVPTKDEYNHGTKVAGIIGAKGYNEEVGGVAPNCEFVVVKLQEALFLKRSILTNGIKDVPVYNNVELLAGIEYLRKYSLKENKPMVIYIGIGTTNGSHDGKNITSKYLKKVGGTRGIALVAGVGNEGDSEGHVSNYIKDVEDVKSNELNIPKEFKDLTFYIWIRRPNQMSINIISPSGEQSSFISSKIDRSEEIKFVLVDTKAIVRYYIPENFTGHQVISLNFKDMKAGIWRIQLKGEYIIDGRYDIWLPSKKLLHEGTKFLDPDPYATLTVPSTAEKVVTVSYNNSKNGALVASSGNGFNTNGLINPDITAGGVNIVTTSNNNEVSTMSGSSAATAIVAGCCALLLQWGIINGNDKTMYSIKIRSYLAYGARRYGIKEYPSIELGFGELDLSKTFNVIAGIYETRGHNKYIEYSINNMYVRIPKDIVSLEFYDNFNK